MFLIIYLLINAIYNLIRRNTWYTSRSYKYSFHNRNEKKFKMEKGIKVSSPGCSCSGLSLKEIHTANKLSNEREWNLDSNLLLRRPYTVFNCSAIRKILEFPSEVIKFVKQMVKSICWPGSSSSSCLWQLALLQIAISLLTRLNCDPSKT